MLYRAAALPVLALALLAGCPAGAPEIVVTPLSIDFGEVPVAEEASRLLTIENSGEASAVVSFALTPDTPFDISLDSALSIDAGDTRTLFVVTSPTGTGLSVGTLTLAWGDQLTEVDLSVTGTSSSTDADEDGYTADVDCDDDDPDVNPGADEICNGVDDDCEGGVDEDFDADGDDFTTCGDDGEPGTADDDCDDDDASANPGATEICDEVDNNCDGSTDEGFDGDKDGYTSCGGDCDDGNAAINPDAVEIPEDGIDQDCSGNDAVVCFYDGDNEGHGSPGTELTDPDGECGDNQATVGDDCDDAAPALNPSALEECDFFDNDCDGTVDRGGGALVLGSGDTARLGGWDLSGAPWTIELSVRLDEPTAIATALRADTGNLALTSEPAWTLDLQGAGAVGADAVTGAWTHLAVTFDGTAVRLFVDGEATLLSGVPAGGLADGEWILGAATDPFVGAIDEVRFWSVARTQEQLVEFACDTVGGDEADLVAWWPFGADADEALSGAPATLTGGAVVSQ